MEARCGEPRGLAGHARRILSQSPCCQLRRGPGTLPHPKAPGQLRRGLNTPCSCLGQKLSFANLRWPPPLAHSSTTTVCSEDLGARVSVSHAPGRPGEALGLTVPWAEPDLPAVRGGGYVRTPCTQSPGSLPCVACSGTRDCLPSSYQLCPWGWLGATTHPQPPQCLPAPHLQFWGMSTSLDHPISMPGSPPPSHHLSC